MPVVFERLAAQLREPVFRDAEEGYDPDQVRAFLDECAARLSVLEARVAKASARADKLERRVAAYRTARRGRPSGAADAGVLDRVVMEGQERAARLVAEAAVEADRLRSEGSAQAAAASGDRDAPELRAEVDAQRAALRAQQQSCRAAESDLDAVAAAVADGRGEILDGLQSHLRELAAMPFPLLKEACP